MKMSLKTAVLLLLGITSFLAKSPSGQSAWYHRRDSWKVSPASCGDGRTDASNWEECDVGADNGKPGIMCTVTCQNESLSRLSLEKEAHKICDGLLASLSAGGTGRRAATLNLGYSNSTACRNEFKACVSRMATNLWTWIFVESDKASGAQCSREPYPIGEIFDDTAFNCSQAFYDAMMANPYGATGSKRKLQEQCTSCTLEAVLPLTPSKALQLIR